MVAAVALLVALVAVASCSDDGAGASAPTDKNTAKHQAAEAKAELDSFAEGAGCAKLKVDPTSKGEVDGELSGVCDADLTVEQGATLVTDAGYRIVAAQTNEGQWVVQAIGDPAIGNGPVDTVELFWTPDKLLTIAINGALVELDADEGWVAVPAAASAGGQ